MSEVAMKIGVLADIHGDLDGFEAALRIYDKHGISKILCAGDIVDRGGGANKIIEILKDREIVCIKGNHEVTIARNQEKYRQQPESKQARLAELGRIISDEALDFIEALPLTARLTLAEKRILMAHGTPTSDIVGVFPDSRDSLFERLHENYGADTDIMILGHTHEPLKRNVNGMWILNPGSIYDVTIRDSATCAILQLPEVQFTIYDLGSGTISEKWNG